MKQLLSLFLFASSVCWLSAQVDTAIYPHLEEKVFELFENQMVDEEQDFTEEMESLLQLQGRKINLNNLEADVAYTLLGMTEYQYYQLQLYIELYGELVTVGELAAVEGFERTDVERLKERVEVLPVNGREKMFAHFFSSSQQSLLLRYGQVLERQQGYEREANNGYRGSPQHLTFKYTFQSGDHFALAFAGEKDPGEQFFKGAQKQGFDHYAFFVNIKQVGVLKCGVIGDYYLNFGQGLVMGARSMGSKGGGAAAVRRFPTLLRAAAPMNEGVAMRGAAAVIGNARFSGTLFYGTRCFDGSVTHDSTGTEVYEGSLSNTGLHRTLSEIARANQLWMHSYGAHLQVKKRIFEVGLTGMSTHFSLPVSLSKDLYRQFMFRGRVLCNAGIDYKLILRKTVLFGEVGASWQQGGAGWGAVCGVVSDPDPRCKLSALFRYYSRKYVALSASAFSANGGCNDETGLYMAADFVAGRNTLLSVNADCYHASWLKYQKDSPGTGFDLGARFSIQMTRHLSLLLKYQYFYLYGNENLTGYYKSVVAAQRHKGRICLQSNPTDWLQLKTECDFVWNVPRSGSPSHGVLLFQDVGVKFDHINLGAKLRIAFFDTDSYAERMYAYEHDLLYTFTIASYYGKGIRYYLLLNYSYLFFDLQVRFSQTFYDDRQVISSAQALINGNTKSDLRIQMIFHIRKNNKGKIAL